MELKNGIEILVLPFSVKEVFLLVISSLKSTNLCSTQLVKFEEKNAFKSSQCIFGYRRNPCLGCSEQQKKTLQIACLVHMLHSSTL